MERFNLPLVLDRASDMSREKGFSWLSCYNWVILQRLWPGWRVSLLLDRLADVVAAARDAGRVSGFALEEPPGRIWDQIAAELGTPEPAGQARHRQCTRAFAEICH